MTITANDRAWFRSHPNRLHRCHLATIAELNAARDLGVLDRKVLADGYFMHCLARFNRSTRETRPCSLC
jgi:hypothetical protein